MMNPDRQRGAALLSILLIVSALAVAALIATTAIARQSDLAKSATRRSDANWAAYSAEALALSAVGEVASLTNGQLTPLTSSMSEPFVIPIRGGVVSVEISDATNCFNINALGNTDENTALLARVSWVSLLVDAGLSATDANNLTNALADWLDQDSNTRPGGAEDGYYLTLDPAYRAANQPMDSPRELAAVLGYTPKLLKALEPLVCAQPDLQMMRLNINTLRPEGAPLLRATYSEALTLAAATRILENRPETGWSSVDQFEALPDIRTIPEGQRRSDTLAIASSTYLAEGQTVTDGGSWPFSFMISASDGATPRTIWRRLGEE